MIGLDTNVLVRFLVRDDEAQFERARRLIRRAAGTGEPVLIGLLVMLETEWVLRSRYNLPKTEILAAFSGLGWCASNLTDSRHLNEIFLDTL